MEFAPQGVNVLLLVIHSGKLHQVIANGRVCTVCSNHEIKGDFDFSRAAIRNVVSVAGFKPCLVLPKVGSSELVVEEQLDVGHGFQDVEQPRVESSSINSIDSLFAG